MRMIAGQPSQEAAMANLLDNLKASQSRAAAKLRETCEGFDEPDERCPRHPSECVCWEVHELGRILVKMGFGN